MTTTLDTAEQTSTLETAYAPDERRCTAHNNRGERCRQYAIRGGVVCNVHGGRAPQVKAAAKRRLALQEGLKGVAALVAEHGLPEPDGRHPVEHLLRSLTLSAMMVEALGGVVAKHNSPPGDTVFEAWERERDRHAKIAKACADAGVEDRMVKVAEAQAMMIAAAIRGMLTDLGHDAEDPAVGAIVATRLRQVSITDG